MAHTVTVELDTEDVHDLLIALDVIEMLSQDGSDADVNATFAHLIDIRNDLALSLTQEQHVLLSEGIRHPTQALKTALALAVLNTYRKTKTGELVEK